MTFTVCNGKDKQASKIRGRQIPLKRNERDGKLSIDKQHPWPQRTKITEEMENNDVHPLQATFTETLLSHFRRSSKRNLLLECHLGARGDYTIEKGAEESCVARAQRLGNVELQGKWTACTEVTAPAPKDMSHGAGAERGETFMGLRSG